MKRSRIWFGAVLSLALMILFTNCGGGSSGGNGGGGGGGNTGTITSVTASCVAYIAQISQTDQCTATVTGTGTFNSAVNWSASAGSISSAGLLTLPASTGNVTVTATAAGDSTKTATQTVKAITTVNSGFTYEGITHVSWSTGEYSSGTGAASQDAIPLAGGNWAGVLVTWYMPTYTSTTIAPNSGGPSTPSDADVVAAITELHAKGMKVMLKPHVDVLDNTWRGAIAPSDVNAWFTSFNAFILHFAQLAEANGVEMLCFGTEYKSMSGSANLANWTNTISQIRNAYSGLLAYAANASSTNGDEYTSVSFWDQVDVIGLDGYFSLTNHADPTLTELTSAWSNNKNNENLIAAVKLFAASYPNQPVIFTEIGYRSVAGANINPWDYSTGSTVDDTEQRNCYEAMYEVWSQQTAIKGSFWWAWPVPAPVLSTDTDYNPRNKPAEVILQTWQ
jgi:serralysin